mgnify:FL=1
MQSTTATVDEYLATLPEDSRGVMTKLQKAIKKNIPKGFKETMGYGNMGWVVPILCTRTVTIATRNSPCRSWFANKNAASNIRF